MCRFCVEHGDGKKWYLEASTYAYDLSSDLERGPYILHLPEADLLCRQRPVVVFPPEVHRQQHRLVHLHHHFDELALRELI